MSDLLTLEDGDQAIHIPYKPNATSAAFIRDTAFITGYFGPFGCGKTSAGAHKGYEYGQAFPGRQDRGLPRHLSERPHESVVLRLLKA